MKYKVFFYMDGLYEVWEYKHGYENSVPEDGEVVFTGTLPECDAFINLTEKGYLNE